jgi:pimeloyl-ACP methyl ester carboxylesterase
MGLLAREGGRQVYFEHYAWRGPAVDASLGTLAQPDQRAALAMIAAPSLVVVGARDGVVPPGIGREAAKLLPNATLCEFDCGHAPFLELPDAYHAARSDLLGKC